MSVLIVGDESPLTRALVRRLVDQDDEVRSIEAGETRSSELAMLGAHVARGPYLDADLVERAGQNVRTVVAIDQPPEILSEIIEGMKAASIPRLVLCAREIASETTAELTRAGIEFVVLKRPVGGLLRKGVPDEAIAEAIDAADDLAGEPRLQLDLGDPSAWTELRLTRR